MTPDVEPGAADPIRSVRATFKGIGALVAPTSAVTALLYYFGWTRSHVEAHRLGLDESLLGYSTQDYLLRSISSMLAPLIVGLLAALAALTFHAFVLAWAHRRATGAGEGPGGKASPPLRWLAGSLAAVGLMAVVFGLGGDRVDKPSAALYMAAPVAVTVGIALLAYAVALYRRVFAVRHPGSTWGTPPSYDWLAVGAVVMLLLVSLFWDVGRFAAVKGNDLARQVEATLLEQPGVILYSQKRLYLQPPVVETRLDPENAAYNYAYSGLKFLFRADGKYFLRPADERSRVNIIIPDGLDIRLELYP
jgi:hypothetical protein